MGLHLTGKGSILDALGGALNTGANAVVSGVKDVGDLGAEGIAGITNNPTAYNNASNAIKSNDNNLSGGSFATNLGGLAQDTGITQAAKSYINTGVGAATDIVNGLDGTNQTSQEAVGGGPLGTITKWASNKGTENEGSGRRLAGNALMTAVNLATLGKGKALEQGAEKIAGSQVGDSVAGKAIARIFGSSTSAGAYGAGQGASNAVSTAKNAKEAVTDVVKPALQNAELGGLVGGITTLPSVASGTVKVLSKPVHAFSEETPPPVPDNVTEQGLSNVHEQGQAVPSSTEPLPSPPSPEELEATTHELHQSILDPTVDWTKVAGSNDELAHSTKQVAESFKAIDDGATGGQLISTADGGKVRTTEHSPFYSEVYARTGAAPTKAMWQEYAKSWMDDKAADHTDPDGAAIRDLYKRSKAETDITNWQKIDKSSGYSKTIPKGASARPFIQALSDRIHSPEYAARNEVGARLEDTRTLKETRQTLLNKSEKDLKGMNKQGSSVDEATIRAKANEVLGHRGAFRSLTGIERDESFEYSQRAKELDAKHPNLDFDNTKPKVNKAGEAEELALSNKVVDGVDPKTLSAKTPQGKTYLENEVNKTSGKLTTSAPVVEQPTPAIKTTSTKPTPLTNEASPSGEITDFQKRHQAEEDGWLELNGV